MNHGLVWLEIARTLQWHHGGVEVPQLAGGIAEHEKRQVRIRRELRGLFKIGERGRHTVYLPLSQAFLDQFTHGRPA